MRRALLAIGLLLTAVHPALAQRVAVPETSVTFEAPEGFTALTQEEINALYPLNTRPKYVIGNARRSTVVAFELKPLPLSDAGLPEVLEALGQQLQQIVPSIEWIERKLTELEGQRWLYLEFTSPGMGSSVHNIIVATPIAGRSLFVSFNSTKEEFPKAEEQLRRSLQSIRLNREGLLGAVLSDGPETSSDRLLTASAANPGGGGLRR
jgi:hypothetical protein